MVRPRSLVVACFVFLLGAASLNAGDLRIPLPKRSKYTPVQALNRDGVRAVEKHQYERAKKLFYKAYLIDPNDPFTLNNLGYMAEIEGETDRARRFYALSAEMGSDAIIDRANNEVMLGKPVSSVAGLAEDKGIKVNRLNNQAIELLEKDRAPEADLTLQKALTIDPQNPFTLNNLGYAKEKEGEIDAAYQFYTASANRGSPEKVEVAIDKDWRGRAISDVARDNARKLNRRLRDVNDTEARVAILNLRGVSALNRNDRRTGRDFIQQAFKLAPTDAFTLNNMGYLAEMDGDKETADFYYERAREANQKNERIAIATRKEVEGKKIGDVADTTDQLVQSQMEAAREARERQGGPVVLKRRDNTAIVEPLKPASEPPRERVSNENGEILLPPRPRDTMSAAPAPNSSAQPQAETPSGGLMMPLPENEQPTTVKEGQHDGGMIMPLPDDQQPSARPTNPQQPSQPKEGPHDGGMIMPLPDNQQPGAQPQPQSQSQPFHQTQSAPAVQAPPASRPAPTSAPPTNIAPSAPVPAPTKPAPQPPEPSQRTPLLLPPPDKQRPQTQSPARTPQNNTGVYAPPPASSNPGNYSNSKPAPPKHITDTDSKPAQRKPAQPNGPPPKHISDQDN